MKLIDSRLNKHAVLLAEPRTWELRAGMRELAWPGLFRAGSTKLDLAFSTHPGAQRHDHT